MQNPDANLDLTDSLRRLETDGFVALPGLCDSAMIASILDVSRRVSQKIQAALGDREIGIGSAAGFIEIVQRSPGRWDVPITPAQFGIEDHETPWWPLVSAALGDDAEHSFSGVVSSEPQSPAQEWHIDSPHESPGHLPPHAINVLVALHDISMTMGPTEFAIGSHRLTNHHGNTALVPDELIYQHAQTSPAGLVQDTETPVPQCHASDVTAGTCLVFDDRLLHRGLANDSDATRHVAYFSYRKKGYVGDTHFESTRSVYS